VTPRTPERPEPRTGTEAFPRGELFLACGLALALRLVYLVGVAQGPLFLHPVIESPEGHPYGWFLAALSAVTGNDPLLMRLVQALMDTASVFLLGAGAYERWGRGPAVFTAQLAALYGPLIYFASDFSPGTFCFFLVAGSLYLTARAARAGGRLQVALGLGALLLATALTIAGGGAWGEHHAAASGETPYPLVRFFASMALAWNWRELPCGSMDQAFFASFHSPIFRLPWLFSFAFVGPVALMAAMFLGRRGRVFVGYLVFATVAVAATHVCDRTRLTVVAAAIPLAGYAIDRLVLALVDATRKGRKTGPAVIAFARGHGSGIIVLACSAALVIVPFPELRRAWAGEGWADVARAYAASENPRAAQKAYASAEQRGLKTADFYAEWGRFEFDKRVGILAEQHLLTAVTIDPENAVAHEVLGEVFDSQDNDEKAGVEFAIAAGLVSSRSAELYTRAGESYESAKNSDRATEMFLNALHASPGYPAAQEGLGRIRHPAPAIPPVKMLEPLNRKS